MGIFRTRSSSLSIFVVLAACSSGPKAPDTLTVSTAPAQIPADGSAASTLTITASSSTNAKLTTGLSALVTTQNGFFGTAGTTSVTVPLTADTAGTNAIGSTKFSCTTDVTASIKTVVGNLTKTSTVTCGKGSATGSSSGGGSSSGSVASLSTVVVSSSAAVVAETLTVSITATLAGADGTPPTDGTPVLFVASVGTWGTSGASTTTATTTKGVATATFTAPKATGTSTITASFTDSSGGSASGTLDVQVVDGSSIYVNVSSAQSTLTSTGATSTITATLFVGATPTANKQLTFTLTGPSGIGTLAAVSGNGTVSPDSRTLSSATTDSNGQVTATFISGVARGSATITVSDPADVTAIAGTAAIAVSLPLSLSNASFVSTSPSPAVISVRGASGASGTSTPSVVQVVFAFSDQNGQPVSDGITVTFEVTGTHSQEVFVDPAVQTTAGGQASTFLDAGTQAETVVVRATASLGGVTVSAVSPSIAIVGGLPEYSHMSIACDVPTFEAPGLSLDGITQKCTVTLADRFSNRVPNGTEVDFRTEAGNIDSQLQVQGGTSQVQPTLISGDPRPRKFFSFYAPNGTRAFPRATALTGPGAKASTAAPSKVQELVPEAFYSGFAAARPYIDETNPQVIATGLYPADPIPNQVLSTALLQSRGHVKVIAITQGEESFIDGNGNKQYDPGEAFIDLAEPFIDKNDNGVQDDCGTLVSGSWVYAPGINSAEDFFDCHEDYIDLNGNGTWDAGNGVWDASTSIWKSIDLVWTSAPYLSMYPTTTVNKAANNGYDDTSAELFNPATGLPEPQGSVTDTGATNPANPVLLTWNAFALETFIVRAEDINLNCPHGTYGYSISKTDANGIDTNQVGNIALSGGAGTYLSEVPYNLNDCDFEISVAEATTAPTIVAHYYGSLDVTLYVPSFNPQTRSWGFDLNYTGP